jgi:hypothetical protein
MDSFVKTPAKRAKKKEKNSNLLFLGYFHKIHLTLVTCQKILAPPFFAQTFGVPIFKP